MNIISVTTPRKTLDMELCRALFEKDPDRVLELVSDWLEANRLVPSDDFEMPVYLETVLDRCEPYSGYPRNLRVLVS